MSDCGVVPLIIIIIVIIIAIYLLWQNPIVSGQTDQGLQEQFWPYGYSYGYPYYGNRRNVANYLNFHSPYRYAYNPYLYGPYGGVKYLI